MPARILRHWPALSVGLVLVVAAVVALSLCVHRVRARALLLEQLEAMGADVETNGRGLYGPSVSGILLRNCEVSDEFVVSLRQFQEIEGLALSGTGISDDALQAVGDMQNLEWLVLSETRVTDAGIAHLSRLHKLESLQLCDADVSDASIPLFSSMPALTQLSIRYTNVTLEGHNRLETPRLAVDWVPRGSNYDLRRKLLRLGADLFVIDLGGDAIEYELFVGTDHPMGRRWSGSLADFREVNDCENLTWVRVQGPWFTDDYLRSILESPALEVLVLQSTSVTEIGCLEIPRCSTLRSLTIEGTKISDGVLERLRSENPQLRIDVQR